MFSWLLSRYFVRCLVEIRAARDGKTEDAPKPRPRSSPVTRNLRAAYRSHHTSRNYPRTFRSFFLFLREKTSQRHESSSARRIDGRSILALQRGKRFADRRHFRLDPRLPFSQARTRPEDRSGDRRHGEVHYTTSRPSRQCHESANFSRSIERRRPCYRGLFHFHCVLMATSEEFS